MIYLHARSISSVPRILILENINVRKNIREFFEKMQEFFPSTKNAYIESVEEYGEVLETVVIEDIFMPELLTLLAKNEDAELLSNMFNYSAFHQFREF